MKVFTFAIICTLSTIINFITATPTTIRRNTDKERTDYLLFSSPMREFQEARNKALEIGDTTLNFTSDGCTKVANKPLGFNFLPCCQRHDFGYRNYQHQGRFSYDAREKINENFKHDMDNVCDGEDNTNTYHKNPLPGLAGEVIKDIVELIKFFTDNDGNTNSGDISRFYSKRTECNTIAESYYGGVTIYGWINDTRVIGRASGRTGGVFGNYGVIYKGQIPFFLRYDRLGM
ncbi:prokaryotic phospholipase A2-domain-containing protein [Trichophaea hybrida]|nr:prokaryotic phospholipase A2-domain-containing protein [Trichophaea hybrida]